VKFQALVVLLSLLAPSAYAEFLEDSSSRLGESPKIHPILAQWMESNDPETFAKDNGLPYSEGKVSVYVHMTNSESISKIPSDVEVKGLDGKIAVAFVTPGQLDALGKLDFVERIALPDVAHTPHTPKVGMSSDDPEIFDESMQENRFDSLIWYVVAGVIAAIPVILLKIKKRQN